MMDDIEAALGAPLEILAPAEPDGPVRVWLPLAIATSGQCTAWQKRVRREMAGKPFVFERESDR